MKDSKTELALIEPKILNAEDNIRAWFTKKNSSFSEDDHSISGLNLGFNTSEKKETVALNRLVLYDHLNLDHEWVAYADQVHSNKVQFVTQGGIYPATDGLLTLIPGLTLAIQVADCAAVLLWDAHNKVIGALHAGWRGAVGDIVPIGVEKLVNKGADLQKMKAFVSPCISLEKFEVGQEVASQFPDEFVDYEHYVKPHVDLKGFLKYQLKDTGVKEANIEISEECTLENAEEFYSYRREGERSGRMMALIQIAE